jgi:hypothetical protein
MQKNVQIIDAGSYLTGPDAATSIPDFDAAVIKSEARTGDSVLAFYYFTSSS